MSLTLLATRLKQLEKTKVESGLFETSVYPDGTSAAYVASIQEYGYQGGGVNIPPRPFLRPAIANHSKQWAKLAATEGAKSLKGMETTTQAANKLGLTIEGDILESMLDPKEPLSRVTLLLRKWRDEGRDINKSTVEAARRELANNPNVAVSSNTTPLSDTGYLMSSLTYEVTVK